MEGHLILCKFLWPDQSKFDNDDITDYHNVHFWALKGNRKPHKKKLKVSQRRFSLNFWMGIIDEHYKIFLRGEMFGLLGDVPLETPRNMW